MNTSSYYQAIVERSSCWYVVAILRSFEHTAFDRTIDIATSKFEFFVPTSMEEPFCAIMEHFKQQGLVSELVKLPNRITECGEPVWPDARW